MTGNSLKTWLSLMRPVTRKACRAPLPRLQLNTLEDRTNPAPFVPGDLVVSRVGDGTAALDANTTAVFLDELNTSGVSVNNSVALSTSNFSELGTRTNEGYLTDSADGHSLVIAGYGQAPGTPLSDMSARVIATVSPGGAVDTTTQLIDATLPGVRVAASADGLGFFVATSASVRYVPFGNPATTPSVVVTGEVSSPTAVGIFNGKLWASAGAGAQSNGVPALDSPFVVSGSNPLPQVGGQAIVFPPTGFPTTQDANKSFPTSNQFAVSPDGKTIFIADGRTTGFGGLYEYTDTLGDGNYSFIGRATTGTGADSGLRGLVADFSSGNPVFYATTTAASGNRLVSITGGTLDGNPPGFVTTTLRTAATNTAYRGVALAPTAPGATASATSLSVDSTSATYGNGVTLTATVTAGATGWVSFRSGGVEVGAAPINGGSATFATAGNLPASATPASLVAVYTGNSTYAPSTSAAQAVTITKATPGVAVSFSANPVATGVSETLTATVQVPAGTLPTGTITFFNGSTQIGTTAPALAQVIKGGVITFTATVSTTFPTLGNQSITAQYSGDSNFNPATSPAANLAVINSTSTTVATSNASPAAGNSVVLRAAVASAGAGTITGTVQFYDDTLAIGTPVAVSGGAASVTVTTALLQAANSLTPGLHSVSAVFTPDASSANSFGASTGVYEQAVAAQAFGAADTFAYRVGDGTTSLNAVAPNPIAGNGSVGATIYIDEYTPAGTLVQSVILPSADGAGAQAAVHAVVGNGQQSTTGQVNLSGDGQYLFVTGYDNNPLPFGTALALPSGTGSNNVPRSIARIRFDGAIDTVAFTVGTTGINSTGNFNAVYSPDGNRFYVGGNSGVYYFPSFAPSAALQGSSTANLIAATTYSVSGLQALNGNLIAVGGNGTATTSPIVGQVGTGFPTSTATITSLPGLPTTGTAVTPRAVEAAVDVYFTHLDGTNAPAGINTFYLADRGASFGLGAITKWTLGATGSWSETGFVNYTGTVPQLGFYYLAGRTAGNAVTLFSTYGNGGNADTGPGYLYSVSDTAGYGAAPSGTTATTVATLSATSKQTFRGVANAPQSLLAGTAVNGGQANPAQRSRITSLAVTFREAVNLTAGAFTLTQVSDGSGTPTGVAVPASQITATLRAGTTATYDLTFSGSGLVQAGSLADGVYQLTVNAPEVTSQSSGARLAASYSTPLSGAGRIARLFGDINGDGSITSADLLAFSGNFGSSAGDPEYIPGFDVNGDGSITSADLLAFSGNFGSSI